MIAHKVSTGGIEDHILWLAEHAADVNCIITVLDDGNIRNFLSHNLQTAEEKEVLRENLQLALADIREATTS